MFVNFPRDFSLLANILKKGVLIHQSQLIADNFQIMKATETILNILGLTFQMSRIHNLLEIKDRLSLIHYNNLLNQLKVSIQTEQDFLNTNYQVYFLKLIQDLLILILKVLSFLLVIDRGEL